MHPASICLPTERATVSTNKTLAFLETHRVDFVLELRPGYARGGMAGITLGSELYIAFPGSTKYEYLMEEKILVLVSNNSWSASSFTLSALCHSSPAGHVVQDG